MATLVLKPVIPVRTRSSRPPRGFRRSGPELRSGPWRTVSVATGAAALAFFCVLAPMSDDPKGRLFALEATANLPAVEISIRDTWDALAFEFTPTMLGPAITAEMLTLVEESAAIEEDGSGVTMPLLEVTAVPPIGAPEAIPPG